jgi:hypothetical protein
MDNMIAINKIVVMQEQQDYPERTCTELKSAIN